MNAENDSYRKEHRVMPRVSFNRSASVEGVPIENCRVIFYPGASVKHAVFIGCEIIFKADKPLMVNSCSFRNCTFLLSAAPLDEFAPYVLHSSFENCVVPASVAALCQGCAFHDGTIVEGGSALTVALAGSKGE